MLFVIPTRFDPNRPVVYPCIEAIQKHHPDDRILVVDSNSQDRSYLEWCRERGCITTTGNNGYAHGAFAFGVREYPNEDQYALLFDSLIIQAPLDDLRDNPVTVIRHWSHLQHDWGWDRNHVHLSRWGGDELKRMGIPMPPAYHGVMGPMMILQRSVVAELDSVRYWDTCVRDAWEHCALERVCGIVLEYLGTDIPSVSIQGVHQNHDSSYDERYVKKLNLARV